MFLAVIHEPGTLDSFSSVSHARNAEAMGEKSKGNRVNRGAGRDLLAFAIVHGVGTQLNWPDRVDSMLNEPLCGP